MKSFAFFVALTSSWHLAAALNLANLSPLHVFSGKHEETVSKSSSQYPNIAFNFDLSQRSDHVAKDGPLFVIAFDIDETLLQCDYRRPLRCMVHPFTMVLVNYLQGLTAMPNSRLYSVVGLTNGLQTSTKFATAGLPGVSYFFRTLYERQFVHFYNPLSRLKDLAALSKQLAHDDADYAKVADRTVIILIDDLGNTHEVFNRCHKGNLQHVGLNVAAFAPFSSSQKVTNGYPFEWSQFNLSVVSAFLATYFSDVELHQQAILTNAASQPTHTEAAVHAAELFRLHASVAGVGRTDVTSSMYSQRKFASLTGHVDPLVICPHEKLAPAIGGESPVYAVLMLDARWMFKYIKNRNSEDDNNLRDEGRISQQTLIEESMQELISAFRHIEPLVTDIVVKCYEMEINLNDGTVLNCQGFADTLRLLWQSDTLEGDPPMLRPDPFIFTFEHMYLNRIGARQYNILSVILEALAMPEESTVLLVMDAVTPDTHLNRDHSEAINDLFKPQAGFFKSGPSGTLFHNQKNRKMKEHLEYQFVLENGVGAKLSNLHNFFERLAYTLRGSALTNENYSNISSNSRFDAEGKDYGYELEQKLSRHLSNRNRQRGAKTNDFDGKRTAMQEPNEEPNLYDKLIDLYERIGANFGSALVYDADEIAIPFYGVT